jgi:uncharacterized protein
MSNILSHFKIYDRSPFSQLIISVTILLTLGIMLFLLAVRAGSLIYGVSPGKLAETLSSSDAGGNIVYLRYLIVMQEITIFVIPAFLILILLKPENARWLPGFKVPAIHQFILVIILSFCLFPVTVFTGQLNSGLHLPDWLSDVQKWITEKEGETARLINLLIRSDSIKVMMFNLLMIAVLPALGEELVFRGILQRILQKLFHNGHIAVWLTAIIFSTVHLQFFGFVPRFILGLVFGYLFFLTGNLWLPVAAHFVNNAVPVIVFYLQGGTGSESQPDNIASNELLTLPLPVFIIILIMIYFRRISLRDTV